jgi:hypothetical protein
VGCVGHYNISDFIIYLLPCKKVAIAILDQDPNLSKGLFQK